MATPSPKKRSERPVAGAKLRAGQIFEQAAEVVVATATSALTYGIPSGLIGRAQVGCRVRVPVRGRLHVGVIWRVGAVDEMGCPVEKLRPLDDVLDDSPLLPTDLIACLAFAARYYHSPLGSALRLALPSALRHTEVQGDAAPVRTRWLVGRVDGLERPTNLRATERRVLDQVLARGEMAVSDLRRSVDPLTGAIKRVSVPQKTLEQLAASGLIRLWEERVLRDPLGMRTSVAPDQPPALTEEQRAVLASLLSWAKAGRYRTAVLRGVTGSGKTEVYLHLIAQCLDVGKTAVVLVPEIALTPQLVHRFRARFGDQIAALHSQMSEGERLDQLRRVRDGEAKIVIGPRSALFAPIHQLGVVVLDECHDSSFKQQAGLRYHARDLAMVRAQRAGALCVLGSATPSCEEMALVQRGRADLLEMRSRVADRQLPTAFTVDLRVAERLPDPFDDRRPSLITAPLLDALRQVIDRQEQAIILHNRRGFAVTVVCAGCGEAVQCPHCAISLTYHQRQRRLRCHYCDYSQDPDTTCQPCGGRNFLRLGAGTERVEDTFAQLLPGARVQRFDRDTANGQQMLETLDRFRRGELDVLVGTQMLAKGHDFPRVTLVGVLLAETGLRMPHFRAAEQTFQLITQVAGRAGRGERPGQVYVQTFAPEHPAIRFALAQDHDAFVEYEQRRRELTGYPPFSHLALIEVRHRRPEVAMKGAQWIAEQLRRHQANVIGPVLAGVAKLRDIHRVHVQVRAAQRPTLHGQLKWVMESLSDKLPTGSTVFIDVDPVDFS